MTGQGVDSSGVDLRDLDRRALAAAGDVIAQVRPGDLGRPTPCADWTLGELLRHLVSENRGFAANAAGTATDRSVWNSGRLGDDPYRAYVESAAEVTAAFAAPDIYERQIEVREFGVFRGRVAVGMHFVDFLVHGWDVARSLGLPYRPDADLTASAWVIAAGWRIPDGERGPKAAFDVQVPVPGDAPDFARLLGLLGRSPTWAGSGVG